MNGTNPFIFGHDQVHNLKKMKFSPRKLITSKILPTSLHKKFLQIGLNTIAKSLKTEITVDRITKVVGIVSSLTFLIFSILIFSSFSNFAAYCKEKLVLYIKFSLYYVLTKAFWKSVIASTISSMLASIRAVFPPKPNS